MFCSAVRTRAISGILHRSSSSCCHSLLLFIFDHFTQSFADWGCWETSELTTVWFRGKAVAKSSPMLWGASWLGFSIISDTRKLILLWIRIASPRLLQLKCEWNTCPTQSLCIFSWSQFKRWVSCMKAIDVLNEGEPFSFCLLDLNPWYSNVLLSYCLSWEKL